MKCPVCQEGEYKNPVLEIHPVIIKDMELLEVFAPSSDRKYGEYVSKFLIEHQATIAQPDHVHLQAECFIPLIIFLRENKIKFLVS